MTEFEENTISYAKKITIGSFIIGTLIFLSFLFIKLKSLAYIGVIFLLLAIIANGILFLQLIYLWFSKKTEKTNIRKAILFVLANIPIAFLYLKIGGYLFKNRFGM
jgi:hypothetical protein